MPIKPPNFGENSKMFGSDDDDSDHAGHNHDNSSNRRRPEVRMFENEVNIIATDEIEGLALGTIGLRKLLELVILKHENHGEGCNAALIAQRIFNAMDAEIKKLVDEGFNLGFSDLPKGGHLTSVQGRNNRGLFSDDPRNASQILSDHAKEMLNDPKVDSKLKASIKKNMLSGKEVNTGIVNISPDKIPAAKKPTKELSLKDVLKQHAEKSKKKRKL